MADRFAADFPNDEEIESLRQVLGEGQRREKLAKELAREGRDLCLAGLVEPGLARLREAYRWNPRSAEVRVALLEHLIEHSRELLASDWRTAEVLAREAVALNPASAAARDALELATDRAAEENIRRIIAEARTLQAQGSLGEALQKVELALMEHPTDLRLVYLRTSLVEALPRAAAPPPFAPAPVAPPPPPVAIPAWKRPPVLAAGVSVAVLIVILLVVAILRNLR